MRPRTRYAIASGGVHIAYQVVGEGPRDVVWIPGAFSNLEHWWAHPRAERFLTAVSQHCRLILFDKRGSGLSDRVGGAQSLEQRVDDIDAVMRAAGSEHATIWGVSEGAPFAIVFAASHPGMVDALILQGGLARWTAIPEYPWAMPLEIYRGTREFILAHWGEGLTLQNFCPSLADDPVTKEWWAEYERVSVSPGAFDALWRMNEEIDVRGALAAVGVPTLVLHSAEDAAVPTEGSRYLAAHIPGARLVLLPGRDHLFFGACSEALLAEVTEFLTGVRPLTEPERFLATVLFEDIANSTARASELGDRRWRDLIERHHAVVRDELARHGGREWDTAGDGFFATFDGPTRAVRCATAIQDALRALGLETRIGLHAGECELVAGKVGGLAVVIAARVREQAVPGEILASGTVRDLGLGSGVGFEDRGERQLKGVPGAWRVFAVAAEQIPVGQA